MQRAASVKQSRREGLKDKDSFSESIRRMIESGLLAQASGTVVKSQVIARVQIHSGEIAFSTESISEFFLDLCDLMVSGKLARMQETTFKVYLALMAFRDAPERPVKDPKMLTDITGVTDLSALRAALEQLRDEGYIASVENPVIGRRPRIKGKNGHDAGLDQAVSV